MTLDRSAAEETEIEDFRSALHALYREAGRPSARSISRELDNAVSHTTIADLLSGRRIPSWAITQRVVAHLGGDEARFRHLWGQISKVPGIAQEARIPAGPAAGRLLDEVTDPFDLEVHRPVQAGGTQAGLPALPAYVRREHDQQLDQVVRAATAGASGMAVLVGGSSTGKTRACWEALGLLRERPERWRLWHPIDPSRPEAALRDLPSIGPRTVIWLNEAQFYLDAPIGGLGERVAAGLRELLRDPDRAPVLVLATIWPQFWDQLTVRSPAGVDDHAQARELLVGREIAVPPAFTPDQMRKVAWTVDPRLVLAAQTAEDGRVVQFLAGAPELMARYRNAPPPAAALINAAIDARRLGMGIALPLTFLETAAPGYLASDEWDTLADDWLDQALTYTAAPSKGTRGPLTRVRPRATTEAIGPTYRLADYIEQHGRRARRLHIPPADFWTAAARFASSNDLPALAEAAEKRGLLRDATRLRKHAAERGNANEAANLILKWHNLHPDSDGPNTAQWAAARAALDNPYATARLLTALQEAGAADQVAALAARAAARAPLDNPYATARLLTALQEAGAADQVAALAARAAARAPLDNPYATARLLTALQEAGAADQVAALLARDPAAHAPLDSPGDVAGLLSALQEAGAADQVAALLARDPAAHAPLDSPGDVAGLLSALQEAGAADQVAALLARDPAAHAPLDSPGDVAGLLSALQEAGAADQVAALAARAAAHAPLDSPGDVAGLLSALQEAGAADQVAALLARDPATQAPLGNLFDVVWLLDAAREAGAHEQVTALAARAIAHAPLDDPFGVTRLLKVLLWSGAADQVGALLARDPAARVSLDSPSDVAGLLKVLREAGAIGQVAALLARDPAARVSLDSPGDVAGLLKVLREAGVQEQVRTLVDRLPAEGLFSLFREQAASQTLYRFGREPDGSPAPPWGWDDLD